MENMQTNRNPLESEPLTKLVTEIFCSDNLDFDG